MEEISHPPPKSQLNTEVFKVKYCYENLILSCIYILALRNKWGFLTIKIINCQLTAVIV